MMPNGYYWSQMLGTGAMDADANCIGLYTMLLLMAADLLGIPVSAVAAIFCWSEAGDIREARPETKNAHKKSGRLEAMGRQREHPEHGQRGRQKLWNDRALKRRIKKLKWRGNRSLRGGRPLEMGRREPSRRNPNV
ncbi:hypothetical protein Nepgr_033744 [Nepenthes gracilis]|uniref:Uncharacterized protein n=1 Tax=Nepenthes gracilis TaxID=150966 RepID=A0AAD3TLQ5_NEPGR|nr:hypothetical protein Nepgr_033744 [Nepenthes gracilis]